MIGFLSSYSLDPSGKRLAAAFRDGLKEIGYEEERNVKVQYSSAEGNYDRLHTLAADLVGRRVNVIAAVGGSPAALAAKRATTSVPIVFLVGVDPVQLGIVASLNRPGGNITGITTLSAELSPSALSYCANWCRPRAQSLCSSTPPIRLPSLNHKRCKRPPVPLDYNFMCCMRALIASSSLYLQACDHCE